MFFWGADNKMYMLYCVPRYCTLDCTIGPLAIHTQNAGFGRTQHNFLTKFANGKFKTLQLKAFWPKNIKFHARNQKSQIRNRQFGTFDSLHGI